MDQKTLRSYYKYIVKDFPKTLLDHFFHFPSVRSHTFSPIIPYFATSFPTVYDEFTQYPLGFIPHTSQPVVEEIEYPTRGAVEPLMRTTMVPHFAENIYFYFLH